MIMDSGNDMFFQYPSAAACHGGGNSNKMLFLGGGDDTFRGHQGTMSSPLMLSMEALVAETNKRRPFFSSPEELFDDDYYDEQITEKKRRLTPDQQVNMLEKCFDAENKLEPERKTELAKKLGLQPRQVAVWFQNRRARWKTKQLERDFDLLKSSYDSLLVNYDSLLSENHRLKSQVVSLTEKLEAQEEDGPGPDPKSSDLYPLGLAQPSAHQLSGGNLAEDHESEGDSAVLNHEDKNLQLVDASSGDSYFPCNGMGVCSLPDPAAEHFQSEEDDGSDNGGGACSFFPNVFVEDTKDQTNQDQDELGWSWVWP